MEEYEEVQKSEIEDFANENNLFVCYTSAKENIGIQVKIFSY